jgi:hypothetical protein
VNDVIDAVMEYIQLHNQDSTPYLWKAKAEEVIEKVKRARATLQKLQTE